MLTIFSMGGYALDVWPAYGLATVALLACVLSVKRQEKQVKQRLTSWFKGE